MNQRKLYQWIGKVSKEWTGFSRHFQTNVTRFSVGIALSHSSHIRRIAGCVSGKAASQRRRLQRFVATSWDMQTFFSQWTASVVRSLKLKSIVLVVDETKLKARFGVMVVGVAYEGRCIPLAWRVYRANSRADYPSEGQVGVIVSLLKAIAAGIPTSMSVRVLADRAIGTSPALMRGIMDLNWTFLFRVTRQSKLIQTDGQEVTIYDQVTQAGEQFVASGLVFKNRGRIPAHVRVLWGEEAQERWALVTNDPQLTGWEYAKRMWIEEAFRDLKSHGWQLEQAQFTCPQRMERFWILLVVAYTWLLLWGLALTRAGQTLAPKRRPQGDPIRRWSLFREGWLAFLRSHSP